MPITTSNPSAVTATAAKEDEAPSRCAMCTIRLERLCYERAVWFKALRAVLASGIWIWALWHEVDPALYRTRASECHGCLRFRKNVLKQESTLFRWLDGFVNPMFNKARDSLLTEGEIEAARAHARNRALRIVMLIAATTALLDTIIARSALAQSSEQLSAATSTPNSPTSSQNTEFRTPVPAGATKALAADSSIQTMQVDHGHEATAPAADVNTNADSSALPAIKTNANAPMPVGHSATFAAKPHPQASPSSTSVSGGIEVTVTAERPGFAEDGYRYRCGHVGAFGELPLRDVPHLINVTPAAAWENGNAHTEQDVLLTNPIGQVAHRRQSEGANLRTCRMCARRIVTAPCGAVTIRRS